MSPERETRIELEDTVAEFTMNVNASAIVGLVVAARQNLQIAAGRSHV
jgi:hypothetical protein